MEVESSGCVGLLGWLGKWGGVVRGADLWCQEGSCRIRPSEEEHRKGKGGTLGVWSVLTFVQVGKKDVVAEIRSHP